MSAIHEHTRGEAGLNDYRLVPGSRRELEIIRHAEEHVVRVLGMSLPSYSVHFFSGEDWLTTLSPGRTLDQARPARVLLMSGLEDRALFSVCCHELQHVGDARYPDLTNDEAEIRAEVFAELVVELCCVWCPTGPANRSAR